VARALLIAVLSACSPALEPGYFRCDDARGCPDDWSCHADGLCYPDPESFVDGGRRDGGAREDGALSDGSLPDAGGGFDGGDSDGGAADAGSHMRDGGPECRGPGDCSDAIECTLDECVDGRCLFTLSTDHCLIGGVCHRHGELEPGNACGICVGGTTRWSINAGADCDVSPCATSERCAPDGRCVGTPIPTGMPCQDSPETTICCGGECVETLGNSLHCGACYTACRAGRSCRGGYCDCSGEVDACPADTWACAGGSQCRCMSDADCAPFDGQSCDNMTNRCVYR
jgi:hypothetical protein